MQQSCELIDNLIRNKPADRVGLHENIWEQTLQRWVDEGYPLDENGKPVDPIEHFNFDLGPIQDRFDIMPLRGYDEVIEETDEWIIQRNGAGVTLKNWKKHTGVPEHMAFQMADSESWESDYRPHLQKVDRERLDLASVTHDLKRRRAQKKWTMYSKVFVWEHMRQSMGDMCLYTALLEDPGWIHDYNRVHTDFYKAHYKIIFEEAGKPDGMRLFEDLGYKNRLFCSPDILSELIFPYYKELVNFFHSYDLPVIMHSCGGIEDALDLIVEAGFDALDPLEVKAGCDAIRFAEKYSDTLMFRGGLDVRILESGDRNLIRKSITDLIQGMKSIGARYVFSSDHSLSTNVSYATYQYALEVYHEHKMY